MTPNLFAQLLPRYLSAIAEAWPLLLGAMLAALGYFVVVSKGVPARLPAWARWTTWACAGALALVWAWHLRWLCDWLSIPFSSRMLSWPPGPRESDGVWAPHWYDAVWRSTGFQPWRPRETNLSDHDAAVAQACRPVYAALHARRVQP